MATDDLPEKFDVIVIGTGLLESIVAAAFSRVGHSVLHIDRNDYYCGDWASFNLHGLDGWIQAQKTVHPDPLERPEAEDVKLQEGDVLVECPLYGKTNTNIETGFLVSAEEPGAREPVEEAGGCVGKAPGDSPVCAAAPDPQTPPDMSQLGVTDGDGQGEGQTDDRRAGGTDPAPEAMDQTNAEPNATTEGSQATSGKRAGPDVSAGEAGTAPDPNRIQEDRHSDAESGDTSSDVPPEGTPKAETGPNVWTKAAIEKQWRKFNVDLAPKLLYCRGDMVELLINSDVSKYCEFKTVTRVLTSLNGELQKVPCSRADVFSSKSVSMIEKRMLMKFITFCMEYQKHPEEYKDFTDKPFTEFLDSRKLKPNIRHFIQHSIAMATDTTTTLEGLEKTYKFIVSLGRYGNTAFLWPLYGTGELPQSFARMCAVFGGIYCLRMTASSIIVDNQNNYKGIITTEGHRIESKWLVSETSYLPKQYLPSGQGSRSTSRAILMTDKSIQSDDSEQLSLLHLPCPDDPNRPVTVLELCPSSMACPDGMYLVHLSREGANNSCSPRDDLKYAVDLLFPDSSETEAKPSILWFLYFSQCNTEGVDIKTPDHVVTIPGPGSHLDMDHVVRQARELFAKLCPDEEFLPKAPNPEDIIFDDGKCREAGEGFQPPPTDIPGESASVQASDPTTESEGNPQTGPVTESERKSQTDPAPESEGNSQTGPVTESEGKSQTDPAPESEGNSHTGPVTESEGKSKTDPAPESEGNSQTVPASEFEGKPQTDHKTETEENF